MRVPELGVLSFASDGGNRNRLFERWPTSFGQQFRELSFRFGDSRRRLSVLQRRQSPYPFERDISPCREDIPALIRRSR